MIKHHYYCTNAATTATISLRRTGGKSSSSSSTSENCCCVSTVWMCLFLDLRLLHHTSTSITCPHRNKLTTLINCDKQLSADHSLFTVGLHWTTTFFLRMMHLLCRAAIDGAIDGSYKCKIKCQKSNITGCQNEMIFLKKQKALLFEQCLENKLKHESFKAIWWKCSEKNWND